MRRARLGDIRGIDPSWLESPHIALALEIIDIIVLGVRNRNSDASTIRIGEFPFKAGIHFPGPQDDMSLC